VSVIRESVAAVYEAEESWTQAAQVLAGIDLDSGQRVLDANYKLQKCIKIAQLYLVRHRRARDTGRGAAHATIADAHASRSPSGG
jgi:hypothetical protein